MASTRIRCTVKPEMLMNRLRHLADKLPEAISAARDEALTDGLNHRSSRPLQLCSRSTPKIDALHSMQPHRSAAARAKSQARP